MALRGETIGRAYVRILADGSGLSDDVKKKMKETEPAIEAGGERQGKAYDKGLAKATERNRKFEDSIDKKLDRVKAKFDANADLIGDGFQQRISDKVTHMLAGSEFDKGAREIGDRVGRNIARGLNESDIADADFFKEIIRATREIRQEEEKLARTVSGSNNIFGRFAQTNDRVATSVGRAFGKGARNDAINLIGSIIQGLLKIPGLIAKVAEFGIKGFGQVLTGLSKIEGLGEKVTDKFQDLGEKIAKNFAKSAEGAEAAGQKMGKGGPGSIIAGITAIIGTLIAIPIVVGSVVSAFSLLAGAAIALASAVSFAVAGALAPLVGALLPLAIGFATIALAMNKWSDNSKVSNKTFKKQEDAVKKYTTAVDGAIPGTKKYEEATKNLTAAQDKLIDSQIKSGDTIGASIQKITFAFDGLKRAASQSIFGTTAKDMKATSGFMDNLASALKIVEPLIRAVGGAVRSVILDLGKGIGDKKGGFAQFVREMTTTLPGQIKSLGGIFKNSLGIIGGIFRALQPITSGFLGDLNSKTKEWSDRINSVTGQKGLKKFFDDAKVSAQKVWDILKEVGGIIGDLFASGKDTGDSILDMMLSSLKDLHAWLDAHPREIQDWFDQAEEAAKNVGSIVTAVKDFIVNMDTPTNRKRAQKLFKIIAKAIDAISFTFGILERFAEFFTTDIPNGLKATDRWFTKVSDNSRKWWKELGKKLTEAWDKVTKKWEKFATAVDDFWEDVKDFPDKVKKALTDGFQAALDWYNKTFLPWWHKLPDRLLFAFGAFVGEIAGKIYQGFLDARAKIETVWLPWVKGLPARIKAYFATLPGVIKDWFVRNWTAAKAWWDGTFAPWVRGLPGRIKAYFVGQYEAIKNWFSASWARVKTWWDGTAAPWVRGLPGRIAGFFSGTSSSIRDWFIRTWARVKTWWNGTAWPWITSLDDKIAGAFSNIGTAIGTAVANALKSAINGVFAGANDIIRGFNSKNGPIGDIPLLPRLARGALLMGPTAFIGGDAGPEAVVPLSRPLSQVDPAVRALSAFAQGKKFPMQQQPTGKVVNVGGLTVITPTEDPFAVSREVVNQLVGSSLL